MLPALCKNMVNFVPLRTTFLCSFPTHPKSILRVLCSVVRLSSDHVTLLTAEFYPINCPSDRTYMYGAGRPHVGLCRKFVVISKFAINRGATALPVKQL